MKTLNKDELYQNLQGFLKTKGVELGEGSYSRKIQKSCELLSDAINTSQKGLSRAKVEIDKKLDQVRQVIHEKTAPPSKSEPVPPTAGPAPKTEAKQTRSRKSSKPRKPRA